MRKRTCGLCGAGNESHNRNHRRSRLHRPRYLRSIRNAGCAYCRLSQKQPGATQYQPPQAVLDSWEFRQGIIDNTYYNYTFYDAEQGRTIFLEIGTTTHYNNMQERLDDLSQYSTIGQTIVQDEYWRIDYYPDNEDRTLYGIMPDSGAGYALMIWRDDGENGTQEELISVKDLLGL